MEFSWTPEEQAFRKEVRTFLKANLPADYVGMDGEGEADDEWEFSRECAKKLAAKGWRVAHWPKEYGGLGISHWQQLILGEEIGYHRFPGASDLGTGMVGPSIMIYGTEEQKQFFLNGIASSEIVFCQLFTEPGAGSDLASLQTRAAKDGDDYIISGQKIFTSGGHRADWGWLGARTDPSAPKHRGISTFVVDMKSQGVTVRPLINMTGLHAQNEIFFDDVRLPSKDLVGTENRGWYQMATTLDFERSGAAGASSSRRTLEELVQYAQETRVNGHTLAQEPRVRNKLAQAAIEVEVGRYIGYRIVWMQSKGMIPNKEASMNKCWGPEFNQRLANTGMQLLGLYGQLRGSSALTRLHGRLEHMYKASVVGTIAGGSSEVNRNIIATRGLGLPR